MKCHNKWLDRPREATIKFSHVSRQRATVRRTILTWIKPNQNKLSARTVNFWAKVKTYPSELPTKYFNVKIAGPIIILLKQMYTFLTAVTTRFKSSPRVWKTACIQFCWGIQMTSNPPCSRIHHKNSYTMCALT